MHPKISVKETYKALVETSHTSDDFKYRIVTLLNQEKKGWYLIDIRYERKIIIYTA